MALVVSDTSPIRALHHLNHLSVLQALFGDVVIPPAVERELREPESSHRAIDVQNIRFIRTVQAKDRKRVADLQEFLDPGESEAIVLSLELHADAILIDEADGRAAAAKEGLQVVGLLGILLRAKQRALIPALTPLLTVLRNELNFFISQPLFEQVVQQAGESRS